MKILVCAAIALSALAVLPGFAISASAAEQDCKVTGWTVGGTSTRPIFTCPDKSPAARRLPKKTRGKARR
jgi:hypothetical protein